MRQNYAIDKAIEASHDYFIIYQYDMFFCPSCSFAQIVKICKSYFCWLMFFILTFTLLGLLRRLIGFCREILDINEILEG